MNLGCRLLPVRTASLWRRRQTGSALFVMFAKFIKGDLMNYQLKQHHFHPHLITAETLSALRVYRPCFLPCKIFLLLKILLAIEKNAFDEFIHWTPRLYERTLLKMRY